MEYRKLFEALKAVDFGTALGDQRLGVLDFTGGESVMDRVYRSKTAAIRRAPSKRDISIEYVDGLLKNHGTAGYYKDGKIYVDASLPEADRLNVIAHEYGHAISGSADQLTAQRIGMRVIEDVAKANPSNRKLTSALESARKSLGYFISHPDAA